MNITKILFVKNVHHIDRKEEIAKTRLHDEDTCIFKRIEKTKCVPLIRRLLINEFLFNLFKPFNHSLLQSISSCRIII